MSEPKPNNYDSLKNLLCGVIQNPERSLALREHHKLQRGCLKGLIESLNMEREFLGEMEQAAPSGSDALLAAKIRLVMIAEIKDLVERAYQIFDAEQPETLPDSLAKTFESYSKFGNPWQENGDGTVF